MICVEDTVTYMGSAVVAHLLIDKAGALPPKVSLRERKSHVEQRVEVHLIFIFSMKRKTMKACLLIL